MTNLIDNIHITSEDETELYGEIIHTATLNFTANYSESAIYRNKNFLETDRIKHILHNMILHNIYGKLLEPVCELYNIVASQPGIDYKQVSKLFDQIKRIVDGSS